MSDQNKNSSSPALLTGCLAYFLWGLFPIYFKITESIPALEILGHRILWSVPFGFLILIFRHQSGAVIAALKNRKTCYYLLLASLSMALNWGLYIWAVQQDQIFQASLGYYILPLLYFVTGVTFFAEKLTHLKVIAIILASLGVLILTFYGGAFPYISIILATSFTIYTICRKQADVDALPGLFIETLILTAPALVYFGMLYQDGALHFGSTTASMTALLILAGPITVIPLVAFAFAARRLSLVSMGFLQYIAPTLHFIVGLYYGEAFTKAHGACFALIWFAIFIFSWDSWRVYKSNLRASAAITH